MQVLYFGAREHSFTYLFIFLFIFNFVKICGCQCIWELKFEEYWEECDQLSDTHVIIDTTEILISLLLDPALPSHNRYIDCHTLCFIAPECLSQPRCIN